jgi:hypothetical protein
MSPTRGKHCRPNYRLAKIHRSYTVAEVASLMGVHRHTVRNWLKAGLPTTDQQRPVLVQGQALAAFLKVRQLRNRRPCASGELYCMRCRAPKRPAGGMVEYKAIGLTLGNLLGICPDCEALMNRRVSVGGLDIAKGNLHVAQTPASLHIAVRSGPSVNCVFGHARKTPE